MAGFLQEDISDSEQKDPAKFSRQGTRLWKGLGTHRAMRIIRPVTTFSFLALCVVCRWMFRCILLASVAADAPVPLPVKEITEAPSAGGVVDVFNAHIRDHPDGDLAFSFDHHTYERADRATMSEFPIGVFDSGIGGLTVLEALLHADFFDNDTMKPGADGRLDFVGEKFVYLGDQANMPYGNYPASDRTDYLRELILKDAVFLLGKRYHSLTVDGRMATHFDKAPVKAIVIACNTATAFGMEDVQAMLGRWGVPVLVVGVVDAAARGLKETPGEGAVGVLATLGTCVSNVYPKTVARAFGMAGRAHPLMTQWGSAQLAGVIEGDPAYRTSIEAQAAADVEALVRTHREANVSVNGARVPLQKIILGCTHFPLVIPQIEAAFERLRSRPEFADWIAQRREFVNPAEWTARELFRELARARLRRSALFSAEEKIKQTPTAAFFISIANDKSAGVRLAAPGVLDANYKYSSQAGDLKVEDTIVVPMSRNQLPETGRSLVREKLPAVWNAMQ